MRRNLALAVRRCTERWQDTASVPIKIRPHVGAELAAGLANNCASMSDMSLSALDYGIVPTGKCALPGAYFGDGDNCSMQLRR